MVYFTQPLIDSAQPVGSVGALVVQELVFYDRVSLVVRGDQFETNFMGDGEDLCILVTVRDTNFELIQSLILSPQAEIESA